MNRSIDEWKEFLLPKLRLSKEKEEKLILIWEKRAPANAKKFNSETQEKKIKITSEFLNVILILLLVFKELFGWHDFVNITAWLCAIFTVLMSLAYILLCYYGISFLKKKDFSPRYKAFLENSRKDPDKEIPSYGEMKKHAMLAPGVLERFVSFDWHGAFRSIIRSGFTVMLFYSLGFFWTAALSFASYLFSLLYNFYMRKAVKVELDNL